MKAIAHNLPVIAAAPSRSRAADYLALTKPRLSLLVLFTTLTGYYLGSDAPLNVLCLIHTLLGTALVAASSCAFNQYLEQDADSKMHRTLDRPLPAGRLQPYEVFWFGVLGGFIGTAYLAIAVNLWSALLAGFTWFSYLCLYTPMKTQTWLNTAMGAVPGALPPVIGWVAASGKLSLGAVVLFGILFLWQFPHFYAIAWIHRDDYARGGFKMLSVVDTTGRRTRIQMVVFAALLLLVSLLPTALGITGVWYLIGATVLGSAYLAASLACALFGLEHHARRLFFVSIIHLPLLLLLLALNKV
jgi:protoheme IX farnesyltransferase